jgi:hypothetical protein
MIAPVDVNASPAQLQIIQGSSLEKSASSAPDLNAASSLKKRTQNVLKVAQVSTTLNQAVFSPEPSATSPALAQADTQKQRFTAQLSPSPLVTPKELPKAGELNSDQLDPRLQPFTPNARPQDTDQLLPDSPSLPVKPESRKQQKPDERPLPLVPGAPERLNPEVLEPAPAENPEAKQNPKPVPPPLPSEVFPAPQSPSPSGPPSTEPGNYPDNTGPGAPYYTQNYISPAVSFGRDTLIGATSRFGIARNLSVRPSLFLGNTVRIAVPVTYDFGFNENEPFEKNPLVVFHAGGGLDYSTRSGGNSTTLNPLVVFGADVYLGEGASILLQLGNTFNSDFTAVAGVGLQF